MKLKAGDQIDITIDKMSLHGGGVARHEGFIIFTEFAAPGDQLRVELTEVKKNHAFARIHQILVPSLERKDPPCPAFGRCGGCNWQHLSEESQWKWKQELVRDALTRAWGEPFEMLPLLKSPTPFRYRNRIQLKKNKDQIGYFAKGSHQLVPIEDCLLAEEPLTQAFAGLRTQKSLFKKDARGQKLPIEFENWEISLALDGKAQLTSMRDRDLAFAQVNRFVNQALVADVLQWASETKWSNYLDLYCGAGNFTFPLADHFPTRPGLAVELSSSAIEKATAELKARGWPPKRLEFLCGDVGLFLRRYMLAPETLILLDPPRAGVDESVIEALAQNKWTTLLYVSCDPMTLARDLGRLREKSPRPLKLFKARCFDMFPQTDHIETLVEVRIDSSKVDANL